MVHAECEYLHMHLWGRVLGEWVGVGAKRFLKLKLGYFMVNKFHPRLIHFHSVQGFAESSLIVFWH